MSQIICICMLLNTTFLCLQFCYWLRCTLVLSMPKSPQIYLLLEMTNILFNRIHFSKTTSLYIITFHIHHQKWVLWQGKHFPIHRMKPCQMDWRKLVVLEKMYSVKENISHFIENQTE